MSLKKFKGIKIELPKSDIRYYPGFLETTCADNLFKTLKNSIPWHQDKVRVYGKWYNQPRLTALTALNKKTYSYSGLELHPIPMPEPVSTLKKMIENLEKVAFTTCLLNYYRDGKDSNGWHSDDEKELGLNPVIASVSLGVDRRFYFRKKDDHSQQHKMILENGSLLIMAGETQHHWQHQLPKTSRAIGERINLTFRVIQ